MAAIPRKLERSDEAHPGVEQDQDIKSFKHVSENEPDNRVISFAAAHIQLFVQRFPKAPETLARGIALAKNENAVVTLNQAMVDSTVALDESYQTSRTFRSRGTKCAFVEDASIGFGICSHPSSCFGSACLSCR
jgi:hypothetical protein